MEPAEKIKVVAFQSNLYWEQPAANKEHFAALMNPLAGQADLMVLPEMFTTGFSMRPELYAETHGGDTLRWMLQQAAQTQSVICGSVMIQDAGRYVNRFYWVTPQGTVSYYDKRHLFSMGDEHNHYEPGVSKLIVECKGWKVLPVICYDLRFPVWLRRTRAADYDLMLVVANWPEKRAEHWSALLKARAIENQCYVVAVNRVGADGNGVAHSGNSTVISPLGEVLRYAEHTEEALDLQLDYETVRSWRNRFPALDDADAFAILS